MTLKFTLTNTSYTFNNFTILDLDTAVRDFFDVIYKPPGRMSAGMSCPIKVKFMPKTADDIHSELKVLAKTGPFTIPLVATVKKV